MVKIEKEEVKEVSKEETAEKEEKQLVEEFMLLILTNSTFVSLIKNEGETIELSPVKKTFKPSRM